MQESPVPGEQPAKPADIPDRRYARAVPERPRLGKAVALVCSGNFFEMYDFMVFGLYAPYIAHAFFPSKDPITSILSALLAFGAGFLTRPIGAIVLGAYIDSRGRRSGLIVSLVLMGIGTLSIAAMPIYAQIGLAAPLLILIARLLQGFAAGAQVGAASVYLSEIAPPGQKGFYVAWQSASQQVAVTFAALVGVIASQMLSRAQMAAFGWRIPFIIGCLLVPLIVLFRRWLEESPVFRTQRTHPAWPDIMRVFLSHVKVIALGVLMAVMTTVSFYMITSYTATYGTSVLHLSVLASLMATVCIGVTNFVLLPAAGALSDRIGRRPQLIVCALLGLTTTYPGLLWLVSHPTLGRLLAVELWFAVIYASYNGAMVVFLTEVMPATVRTTGFSFAYSVATAIFGGFTPAIGTALIRFERQRGYAAYAAAPGIWLTLAAAIGLVAVLVISRRNRSKAPLAVSH
jgi:MFS family permease